VSDTLTRPPRASSGLALLILAVAAAVLAYALVGLGLTGRLPDDLGVWAAVIGGSFLLVWIVTRFAAPNADPVLLPTAALLSGLGLMMIYRIMLERGVPELAQQQGFWLLIGLAAFLLVLLLIRDDRRLDSYTYTVGLAGVILLLLPVAPWIGAERNGARLWADLGLVTFQPAEFGRILIVIFLASYLSGRIELLEAGVGRMGMPRVKDLGPVLLAWVASLAVLFLERDLGASLLVFGVFVVMLWVASGRAGYLLVGAALFAIGALIGYALFSHVQARVDVWLHALDPGNVTGFGYGQLAQGWFGLATGGLGGTGLGQGSPLFTPYVASDFIFTAFGEELGILGAASILLLYLVLVGRGFRVAIERTDSFGKLLATGLTTTIGLQTFAIVAGVTRLIPLTGVPLPLVSFGGSSRVATFVILALLVRASSGPWEPRT
jgi:cell division protein FtsW (lipid II flippase)